MKPPNVNPPSAPPDQSQQTSNAHNQHQLASVSQTPQTTPVTAQQAQQNQLHQQPIANITVTSSEAVSLQQQQTITPTIKLDTNILNAKNITTTQPIITTQAIVVLKTTAMNATQEQQSPLALTTQPQNKPTAQTTSLTLPQIQQQQQLQSSTITATIPPNSIAIQQQRPVPASSLKDTNNRAGITPHALITTQASIAAKTNTINSQNIEQQAPLALITQPQHKPPTSIQSTSSPNTPLIQQQPTSQVSVTPTSANVKVEPNRYICCLLDDGVRCDRVAGNASFSARIQKIVASKKMNFALDPVVRHAYICDHHKAVITVAKKSVPTARESKAAARNLAAAAAAAASNNLNQNNLPPQHINNYNELALNQATIQHPVNLELVANQGRLTNNHTGMLISMPMRPGSQIAYGHYAAGTHQNQMGRIDHSVMTTTPSSGFDNTGGGDSISSNSGGVEVDLQQLQVNTLRRYKRHFRVQTRPGLNKMQLAESLKHHFRTLPIIEKEAITYFVYIVKSSRNKLDHNPKAD